MPMRTFPSVWYATDQRVRSPIKLVVFDDKGALEIDEDRSLFFRGAHGEVRLDQECIRRVSIARQTPPWVVYLVLNTLMVVFLWYRGLSVVGIALAVIVGNALGLAIGRSTPWVRVEWEDRYGKRHAAFFAHAGAFGWSGIGGGTKQLYHALTHRPEAEPESHTGGDSP